MAAFRIEMWQGHEMRGWRITHQGLWKTPGGDREDISSSDEEDTQKATQVDLGGGMISPSPSKFRMKAPLGGSRGCKKEVEKNPYSPATSVWAGPLGPLDHQ